MMYVIYAILALVGGFFIGYWLRKKRALSEVSSAEAQAEKIISETKAKQKEMLLEAQDKALKIIDQAKKESDVSADRKGQIGTGDRSEKIRTYNILQDRITDHRIKQSWSNLEKIFLGNIEPILEACAKGTVGLPAISDETAGDAEDSE